MGKHEELINIFEYYKLLESIEANLYSIAENYCDYSNVEFLKSIGVFRSHLIPELKIVEKNINVKGMVLSKIIKQ